MIWTFYSKYGILCYSIFLEADKQQQLENADRDYKQMNEYYQHAKKLYEKQKNEDMEMQALELQMQDVIDGGWLD